MKQVLQHFKTGVISVEEVPVPILKAGCLLVRNKASLISKGTEGGRVQLGKMSLLGKARARPEQVKKVIQALRTEGLVKQTLDVPFPMGYSCAGIAEATAEDVTDIEVGTAVACGGSGIANHAEYVVVPRNLCVPIPKDVSIKKATFTTVGAIAMQGIRMADVRLGENVVVIGLGLVGLLTVLLLKASGCHVLGIDIDPQRVQWVEENGICPAVARNTANLADRVLEFSGGHGADTVIITAAVASNDPIVLAGEITRYRACVVVLGRTVMDAPRDTFLFKELTLRTSYAYGPGADDPTYEKDGHDYPIGFVRWTENRNMACFLNLLNEKKIDISPLITNVFPLDKAPEAFDLITTSTQPNIGVILEYADETQGAASRGQPSVSRVVSAGTPKARLKAGIIGAGSFATNIMIPLLAKRMDVALNTIASATGIKAAALARKYDISATVSDANQIIASADIDCIFIFTRHGSHAGFARQALLAGKHVFVEKPMALTHQELEGVIAAQHKSNKVLMVGFNRRFSPLAIRMKHFFSDRYQPMMIKYRGNVGYRPPEHWLHDPVDGGGVILGEACHYIDYCRWMANSPIVNVDAKCLGPSNTRSIPEDNVIITLEFGDGSLAEISYISNGAKGFSRERCEAHADEQSAVWEDFRTVKLVKDLGLPKVHRNILFPKKGYQQELDAFFSAISPYGSTEMEWLPSQLDSSLAAIRAAESIRSKPAT
jgi:predicted dehydrogenase/threonine dehydrogenase-like Zn-dependent dehydrogenase